MTCRSSLVLMRYGGAVVSSSRKVRNVVEELVF